MTNPSDKPLNPFTIVGPGLVEEVKIEKAIDELICNWSMLMSHSFTEEELNSLMNILGDDFKNQATKIHAHGVCVGKEIMNLANRLPPRPKCPDCGIESLTGTVHDENCIRTNELKSQLDEANSLLNDCYSILSDGVKWAEGWQGGWVEPCKQMLDKIAEWWKKE